MWKAWNKGLTKETDPRVAKYAKSLEGENNPMFGRTGEQNPFYGQHHSEESKARIRTTKKGETYVSLPKSKKKKYCLECDGSFEVEFGSVRRFCSPSCNTKYTWRTTDTVERCKKIGVSNSCKKSDDYKKIHKERQLRMWQDPEYARSQHKAIHGVPNIPEKFLIQLLQELFPNQWKFVGDGQFILAGKNPDFVNVGGQKKIIEHFGEYHHGEGITGIPNELHERQRMDLFAQHGYQTLVIWGHELENVEEVRNRISVFTEN